MDSSWDRDERRSPSSESLKVKATPSFHDPMPHLDIASGAGNTLSHDQAQGSTYLPDDPVVPRKSGDSPALNEGDREYGDFEPGLENDLDPTKSLLENKCLMLSKEIDAMGMGKYQVSV